MGTCGWASAQMAFAQDQRFVPLAGLDDLVFTAGRSPKPHSRLPRHGCFRIPAGKDQIVEPGQRNKLFDLGRTPICALAQPHRSILRQRPYGFASPCESPPRPRQTSLPPAHARIITPSFPSPAGLCHCSSNYCAPSLRLHLYVGSLDAALADLFRVAIFGRFLSKNLYGVQTCMFSYRAALWQTCAAKRAENQFNGTYASSS